MSELNEGNPPCPDTREAALPGGPYRVNFSSDENSEPGTARQAMWLAVRFGLTVEIATTIAILAFSVER